MALNIKKFPPKIAPKPQEASKPRTREKSDPDAKSSVISVRFQGQHLEMLKELSETYDCRRADVLKKAIRMLYIGCGGYNAHITVTQMDGKETEHPIMVNGVAC